MQAQSGLVVTDPAAWRLAFSDARACRPSPIQTNPPARRPWSSSLGPPTDTSLTNHPFNSAWPRYSAGQPFNHSDRPPFPPDPDHPAQPPSPHDLTMPLPPNSSTPAVPGPLIKFPLHPSSTIGQSSYVGSFIATHPPPIPLNDLNTLRNLLDTAFKAAQDRIKFKELNKENIAQRQALQKRAVEAQAEQVNAERKRRAKEEEDRRDKDRKERERLLEEEKREQVKQEEVEAQEGEEEEDDDDMDDEDEVPLAQAAAKSNLPAKQGAGQNNDVKPTLQGE